MSLNIIKRNNIRCDILKFYQISRNFSAFSKKYCYNVQSQGSEQIITTLPYMHWYSRRNFLGFVPDKKDGYRTLKEVSTKEHIKSGLKQLKYELSLWTEEITQTLRGDQLLICPPGIFYDISQL